MIGAGVTLLRQRYDSEGNRTLEAVVEDAKTDDLGQYRIADLVPGKYYVRAEKRSEMEYGVDMPENHSVKSETPPAAVLPTLYPGVIDPTTARTVEVIAGKGATGVDIALVRRPVYRVKVQAPTNEGMVIQGMWLSPPAGLEGLGPHLRSTRTKPGEYEFRGVPAGQYVLEARGSPPGDPRPNGVITIDPYRREFVTRLPVTVAGDLEDVRVTLNRGIEIAGRITIEDSSNASAAGASVHFANADGHGAVALVLGDQTFTTGLQPGHYDVSVGLNRPPLVIRTIRTERVDVFQDGLTVQDQGHEKIEIVLGPDGGTVDGVVLDKDDKPVAGATVVLAPEARLRSRSDSFYDCSTDQNGRYRFANVRPGDYKLFTWEDVEPNIWFDREFLNGFESKGEAVNLEAKGRATVKLHPIASER